jgi:PAS domain S-box-containing protein
MDFDLEPRMNAVPLRGRRRVFADSLESIDFVAPGAHYHRAHAGAELVVTLGHDDTVEVVRATSACHELLGRSQLEASETPTLLVETMSRSELARLSANLRAAARRRAVSQNDYRFHEGDGTILDVEVVAFPLHTGDGRLSFRLSLRGLAAAGSRGLLAEAPPHIRRLTDRMPAACSVLDRELRFVWMNERYAYLTGRDASRVPGVPLRKLVSAEAWTVLSPRLDATLAGHEQCFVYRNLPNGAPARIAELSMLPDLDADGNVQGVVILLMDRTAEEEARSALFDTRSFHDAVLETSTDWIWETDAELRFTFAGPQIAEMGGFEPAEVLGKTPFDFMPEDEAQRVRKLLANAHANRQPFSRLVHRAVRRDGQEIVVQANAVPVFDNDGAFRGYRGVDRDVSACTRLEAQLRHAQKMDAVGRLTAGIAHDFNTLLTVINSGAELALDELAPDDPMVEELRDVLSAGERAAALTRQLLAFSRMQVLQPKTLDVGELVQGVGKMLRRLLAKNVRLETHVEERAITFADPGQIEQVVINLAVNARDAMPRGGTLRISTGLQRLDGNRACSAGVPAGEYVFVSVTDDGIGMDDATRAKIFEPFFTTKEVGKGTGLGLSTVFGIVTQSGGAIEVESTPGAGSTFTVLLPRRLEAQEPETKSGARCVRPATGTLLLVDGEDAVRSMTARVLASDGYRVHTARDVDEALDLIAHGTRVDAVLTDSMLPTSAGKELSDRLRASSPDLKTVYLSSYPENDGDPELAVGLGERLLPKPFSAQTLRATVRELLEPHAG